MIAQFIASALTIFIVLNVMLGACAYLIFLERKVAAWTQDRIGPNRVNFSFGILPFKGKQFGLGQALVDGVKLMLKEDYTPPGVDRVLFLLAPVLAVVVAMLAWAVIPWGGYLDWHGTQVAICAVPINIGVIYILAMGSLGVYGVVVGGYASNNKYSFLGALRATAQMLSYEIPMGLGVLIVILMTGTAQTETLVEFQALRSASHGWNIFYQPLLAIIVFTAILAECNRAPFDLAEAEQELVGGYHTEYSSMKWALFFLAEYMHMITGAALFTLLFLGGWDLVPFAGIMPFVAAPATAGGTIWGALGLVVAKFVIFVVKVTVLLFVMMWVRWTLPRFRFDQLMRLAWRGMIPVSLVLLLLTGILVYFHASPWWYTAANVVVLFGTMIVGPLIPAGAPVNRKVPLAGSRFSPIV